MSGALAIVLQCLLVLSAAVLNCLTLESGSGERDSELRILLLLPFELEDSVQQPSYTEGPIIQPAAELAVEQINNREDILAGYHLNITVANSACNLPGPTTVNFVRTFFHSETGFAGIVGPACSDSAEVVSPITGQEGVAILNFHIVSSPRLTNRTRYGYSFGTVGSSHAYARLFLQLMRENEWESVAVLYEESKIFYLTAYDLLVEELPRVFPQGRISLSVPISEIDLPLSSISDHQLRVVFVLGTSDLAHRMMCLISQQFRRLTYPGYQFVFIEVRNFFFHYPANFTYNNRHYACSVREITEVMEGFLLTHIKLDVANYSTVIVSGVTFNEYLSEYQMRVNGTTTEWANPTYDGVWALALALNNSIPKLNTLGLDLVDYSFGHRAATDIVRDEVVRLRFEGTSGLISFNNKTGYTNASVDLHQLVSNRSVLVGYFVEDQERLVAVGDGDFVNNAFESEELLVHPAVASLFLVFTIIVLILIIITHVLTLVYRTFSSVKASSYRLGQLAFVGCYVIVVCFVCFTVQRVAPSTSIHTTSLCVIQAWFLPLGVTLVLGTVTAKTWRLYRIFVHLKRPGRFLHDKVLIGIVLVLVAVDVILCSVWTGRFNFTAVRHETVTDRNTIEVKVECDSQYYLAWFGALSLYQGFITGTALVLALLTKNIRHESFKTKSVTFLVYFLTVTLFLGFPFYLILNATNHSQVNAEYVVLSLTYLAVVCFCFIFLFFPPILSLLRVKVFHKFPVLRNSKSVNRKSYQPSSYMSQQGQ